MNFNLDLEIEVIEVVIVSFPHVSQISLKSVDENIKGHFFATPDFFCLTKHVEVVNKRILTKIEVIILDGHKVVPENEFYPRLLIYM